MADMRLPLNDKLIERLLPPENGRYIVRDAELKGFFLVVGARKKTFTIQGDLREEGKRAATIRVAIGDTSEMSTRAARSIAKEYLGQISRGQHPKSEQRVRKAATAAAFETSDVSKINGITLRQAWERYRVSLVRKNRSERTIDGYCDHVERIFMEWLDTSLIDLGNDPAKVAAKHDFITKENGPYIANGCMRTLRAIYNHARKTNRELPVENPVGAIDWNGESRRNTGMGLADLKGWFLELAAIDNPIRREFHLFTLLSGCRTAALKEAKLSHLDLRRRVLHVPKPKGGADRAFDIPLSRQMIKCLMRVMRFGRLMHPFEAREWIFPADSVEGHIAEQKEARETLSKWGNDLRQTFRTIATPAGVSELDARMLMNHSIPGVNAGYITRHKLLEDHLRVQQQSISSTIFKAVGDAFANDKKLVEWLALGAARCAVRRSNQK